MTIDFPGSGPWLKSPNVANGIIVAGRRYRTIVLRCPDYEAVCPLFNFSQNFVFSVAHVVRSDSSPLTAARAVAGCAGGKNDPRPLANRA